MADEEENATARIPVKPSTLRELATVTGKGRTYDEKIREYVGRETEAVRLLRRLYKKVGDEDPDMISEDLDLEIEAFLREAGR